MELDKWWGSQEGRQQGWQTHDTMRGDTRQEGEKKKRRWDESAIWGMEHALRSDGTSMSRQIDLKVGETITFREQIQEIVPLSVCFKAGGSVKTPFLSPKPSPCLNRIFICILASSKGFLFNLQNNINLMKTQTIYGLRSPRFWATMTMVR